ncbi:MAG: GYD domain-containing protein [Bacillota bacterium]|nr:GYD domain-containing protein [Bacillota bacterium]
MSLYLMFGKYSGDSLNKISAERTEKAMDLIQENGGAIKAAYATLGDNDLLFVVNFPKISSVIKTSVEMGNMLGINFSTTPAITVNEFDKLF